MTALTGIHKAHKNCMYAIVTNAKAKMQLFNKMKTILKNIGELQSVSHCHAVGSHHSHDHTQNAGFYSVVSLP